MGDRIIRVVVADGREIVRRGLASLLDGVRGLRVVGEAPDGEAAVARALECDPDVALLAAQLPGLDGPEAARRIRGALPRTEVVLIVARRRVDAKRRAFEAGARGVIFEDGTVDQLVDAVRRAANGDYYLPGTSGEDRVAAYVRPLIEKQEAGGVMTPRERQLACLLADGYSTKEAAAVMNIRVRTAETHRAAIMRKLNARNVADVVKYCIRAHLIDV